MIIDSNKRFSFILAFIFPVIGLFFSIKWRYKPWAKNLFWLFCSFTGLVIIFNYSSAYDIYHYATQLKDFYYADISFNELSNMFFTKEGVDIYQFVMVYFTSRFTANAHILFFLYALIYGFFYSRNIWYVYEKKNNENKSYHIGILVLYIALIWPFWQIAGARFGTAFHVFLYGAIPYIFEKDKSKIIFVFLSAFAHFTFIFPIIVFIFFFLVPLKQNILLVIYTITLFIKEINLSLVNDFLNAHMPSFLHSRINAYTNEEYMMIRKGMSFGLHVTLTNQIGNVAVQILLFFSYFILKKFLSNHQKINNLFFFSVLLGSCINIFSLIPIGDRFLALSQILILTTFVFIFSELKISNPYRKRIVPVILLLFIPIILKIRVGCDYFGFSLFGNLITAFLVEDTMPFIEFIK